MRSFLHATATMAGMIVGVGLFAVPYVSVQAGFWVGVFWIALLGLVSLLIHLFFGEVVAGTAGKHRLPGYAYRYLGVRTKKLVTISQTVAFWGAQVAYMLVGGTFLRVLFNGYDGGSTLAYSLAVFAFVAVVAFFGIKLFDRVEFGMTWLLIGVLLFIIVLGVPEVEAVNWTGFSAPSIFVPYGIILFSLAGAPVIPEIWEIVHRKRRPLRWGIVLGTIIAVILIFLFTLVVVGVSGSATTPEAIAGLEGALGARIVWLGALFGFFAVLTSYLVLALYLKELFMYDFRVKHLPAWFFAVWVPTLLVFAGAQNFIEVLDLVGSVFSGFDAMMIVVVALAYFKRRHVEGRRWKTALGTVVIGLLAVGVLQKLISIL